MKDLVIILILYSIVFGLGELLYKKGFNVRLTRKIVHIGAGVVSALLPLFIDLKLVIVLGIIFTALLLWSKRAKLLKSIHKVETPTIGALLFAPSLTLVAIIFWKTDPIIFQGSALVLGLSDGFAGIIGNRFGRKKYSVTGSKTLEGSVTFFVTTLLILSSLSYFLLEGMENIIHIFAGALFLTIIEGLFGKGWDNFFIPLAGSLVFYSFIL